MSGWLENPYILTTAFFAVAILSLILFLTLFELVTRYDDWEEIKKRKSFRCYGCGRKDIWDYQYLSFFD